MAIPTELSWLVPGTVVLPTSTTSSKDSLNNGIWTAGSWAKFPPKGLMVLVLLYVRKLLCWVKFSVPADDMLTPCHFAPGIGGTLIVVPVKSSVKGVSAAAILPQAKHRRLWSSAVRVRFGFIVQELARNAYSGLIGLTLSRYRGNEARRQGQRPGVRARRAVQAGGGVRLRGTRAAAGRDVRWGSAWAVVGQGRPRGAVGRKSRCGRAEVAVRLRVGGGGAPQRVRWGPDFAVWQAFRSGRRGIRRCAGLH